MKMNAVKFFVEGSSDLIRQLTSVPSLKLDDFEIFAVTATVTLFIIPGYFYYIFKMVL